MTPYYDEDGITIYHGDCWEVPARADTIITDPPYARSELKAWSTLAAVATDSLSPGGWVAAYSGEAHLPDVYRRMTHPDLAYRWTMAVTYEGGGQVVNWDAMSVLSEWKPVLLYQRRPCWSERNSHGQFVTRVQRPIRDLIRGGGREKALHPWAQPLREAMQLVEMFSRPGETVLDPFMGSGTTLRAARDMGRKAIGIEVEERYCEIAVQRLAQGVLAL